jgi:CelD/BcsL family acetyltransferase involved in cellulose biosynthesis
VTHVEVARTVDEVEALRPLWTSLHRSGIASDIDFFLTFVRLAPGVVRPHVVVVDRPSGPALIVGRLEERPLGVRLGSRLRLAPTIRALTVVHGGFLGGGDGGSDLLGGLADSLRGERIELLRLRMLTIGSALHASAVELASPLRRRSFVPPTHHWTAHLPRTFDEYLARRSRSRRKSVRRSMRHLEEIYGDGAGVRFFRRRDELDELFADSAAVQRTAYQHRLGVGFAGDELERGLVGLAMEKGWFLGAVLYLRGRPVSFQHGIAYRGTYGAGATAFDPAFAAVSPGTYVLMKAIEELCEDPEVVTLDFGFGDAEDKRAFADEFRLEEDVAVFSPKPRAMAIHAAHTAVLAAGAAARAGLERSGRLGDARRRWRSRLAARDAEDSRVAAS